MKNCDQHSRCTVVYTEDWRQGDNGCPLCNLEAHVVDLERQHAKAIDKANDRADELADQLSELQEAQA